MLPPTTKITAICASASVSGTKTAAGNVQSAPAAKAPSAKRLSQARGSASDAARR